VSGSITDANGTTAETTFSLGLPITSAPFYSALWNAPTSPYRWDVVTFGTDSTLSTTPGWDNVTGLGVPNGAKFVYSAAWQ
jgi:hypothetical protein